jgi:hypothetical protein
VSQRWPVVAERSYALSEPVEITSDGQLLSDTVIRGGAVTSAQIWAPTYERFPPAPSQRGSG